MMSDSKKNLPLLEVNTHKKERNIPNVEWLGLVPGTLGRWNAIDEIQQGAQSIKVGHVQGIESSVVQLTCNDAQGTSVTYTVKTDEYNQILGDADWKTIGRINLGEGTYISEAIQRASNFSAEDLRNVLKEAPYKATLDAHANAMDEICLGDQGQKIQSAAKQQGAVQRH